MSKHYNYKYDEDYTPEPEYGEFSDLKDFHCPECGEDLGKPEEIYGKYWKGEDYQEIDAYKYTCPECGKVFYTKERL